MTLNELQRAIQVLKDDGIDGELLVIVEVEKSDENIPHAVLQRGIGIVGARHGRPFIRC